MENLPEKTDPAPTNGTKTLTLSDGRVLEVRGPGPNDLFLLIEGFIPMETARNGGEVAESEERAGYQLMARLSGMELTDLMALGLRDKLLVFMAVYPLCAEAVAGVPLVPGTSPDPETSTPTAAPTLVATGSGSASTSRTPGKTSRGGRRS